MISAVVRDCISPLSIQLGTTKNPVVPKLNCTIENISYGEDNIQTCLCTLPFCNYLSMESIKNASLKPSILERNGENQARTKSPSSKKVVPGIPSLNKGMQNWEVFMFNRSIPKFYLRKNVT